MPSSPSSVERSQLLALTAQIVAAHLAGSRTETAALPALIRQVYATLAGLGAAAASEPDAAATAERLQPAVPIRKSVQPDYIVCLEDGQKLKMLKRHLMSHYKMTPEQYRERWGLPADYPMVAPNYALHRQALAHKIGLGKGSRRS